MKKYLLVLSVILVANALLAFNFNSDPPYENLLDEEYEAEFVAMTTSDLLKTNLSDVYSHVFDLIDKVDLHQNDSGRYYFVAYGKKDGTAIATMISASDEMADQQYYPSRAELGFASNEFVIDCHCTWFLCLPGGQGTYCGIARDEMSNCQPAVLCFKRAEVEPIGGGN